MTWHLFDVFTAMCNLALKRDLKIKENHKFPCGNHRINFSNYQAKRSSKQWIVLF